MHEVDLMMNEASDASIFDGLNDHLETQLALCDALEKIADDLPKNIDSQECLHLAKNIFPIIKRAHDFEETKLFPIFTKSNYKVDPEVILERLHSEHWEDENHALELQDALMEFVSNSPNRNPEALGYMLRGFFGNLRRHIASEKEFFNPKSIM